MHIRRGGEDARNEQDAEQGLGSGRVDDDGADPVARFAIVEMTASRTSLDKPVIAGEDAIASTPRAAAP